MFWRRALLIAHELASIACLVYYLWRCRDFAFPHSAWGGNIVPAWLVGMLLAGLGVLPRMLRARQGDLSRAARWTGLATCAVVLVFAYSTLKLCSYTQRPEDYGRYDQRQAASYRATLPSEIPLEAQDVRYCYYSDVFWADEYVFIQYRLPPAAYQRAKQRMLDSCPNAPRALAPDDSAFTLIYALADPAVNLYAVCCYNDEACALRYGGASSSLSRGASPVPWMDYLAWDAPPTTGFGEASEQTGS